MSVPLAPDLWIGRTDNLEASSRKARLEGFLSQIVAGFGKSTEVTVTDLRDMLAKVEEMFPNMKKKDRRPFTRLYALFNRIVIPDEKMENYEEILGRYWKGIDGPSIEAMILNFFEGNIPEWPLEEHREVHDTYLKRQGKPSCLRVPRQLRSGLSLALAERYRSSGEIEDARRLVSTAVENSPGDSFLRQLEQNFDPEKPLPFEASTSVLHP